MNGPLLASAMLILIGAAVHTVGGELTDIKHLKRSDVPANVKLELRMSWYLAAIDMAVSGVYLLYLAFNHTLQGARLLVGFTALRVILYGVMALLLLLLTRRDQVFKVPQWMLLIGIGLLAWWGIV